MHPLDCFALLKLEDNLLKEESSEKSDFLWVRWWVLVSLVLVRCRWRRSKKSLLEETWKARGGEEQRISLVFIPLVYSDHHLSLFGHRQSFLCVLYIDSTIVLQPFIKLSVKRNWWQGASNRLQKNRLRWGYRNSLHSEAGFSFQTDSRRILECREKSTFWVRPPGTPYKPLSKSSNLKNENTIWRPFPQYLVEIRENDLNTWLFFDEKNSENLTPKYSNSLLRPCLLMPFLVDLLVCWTAGSDKYCYMMFCYYFWQEVLFSIDNTVLG